MEAPDPKTVIRTGIDVVEIARIQALIDRHERVTQRLFTPQELRYCQSRGQVADHLAARFAAKEAIFKLLGAARDDGLTFHDVEVVSSSAGRPAAILTGRALEIARLRGIEMIDLSLSHDAGIAVAQAVALAHPHRAGLGLRRRARNVKRMLRHLRPRRGGFTERSQPRDDQRRA
jgi:holo-[acyl-carrier protein] synthase